MRLLSHTLPAGNLVARRFGRLPRLRDPQQVVKRRFVLAADETLSQATVASSWVQSRTCGLARPAPIRWSPTGRVVPRGAQAVQDPGAQQQKHKSPERRGQHESADQHAHDECQAWDKQQHAQSEIEQPKAPHGRGLLSETRRNKKHHA